MISQDTLDRVMKANNTLARKNAELEAENLELQKDRDILSFEAQDLQRKTMKCHVKIQFVLAAIVDKIGNEKHSDFTKGYLAAGQFYKNYIKELEEELTK